MTLLKTRTALFHIIQHNLNKQIPLLANCNRYQGTYISISSELHALLFEVACTNCIVFFCRLLRFSSVFFPTADFEPWRGKFYIDFRLPFGLRSSPYLFNRLADAFEWLLKNNYHIQDLMHYLDDYFTVGPANSSVCAPSSYTLQGSVLLTLKTVCQTHFRKLHSFAFSCVVSSTPWASLRVSGSPSP